MEELLKQLEARLKFLMEKNTELQLLNQELEENHQRLLQQKQELQVKQEGAISQIENMIARLRPLEEAEACA